MSKKIWGQEITEKIRYYKKKTNVSVSRDFVFKIISNFLTISIL